MSKRKPVKRAKFVVEPGYVWCDKLGEIHDDCLDPYQMGGEDTCEPIHHRPVYVRRTPDA